MDIHEAFGGKKMGEKERAIRSIVEDIRELRDADFHVCQADVNNGVGECSCVFFDSVCDKVEKLLEGEK